MKTTITLAASQTISVGDHLTITGGGETITAVVTKRKSGTKFRVKLLAMGEKIR